jgi:hypothetical protein
MAIKDYTLTELKEMVLEQANAIKGLSTSFGSTQGDEAYEEANRECGFELPATDDADKAKKIHWLIMRMRRWYLFQLWQQYSLLFQGGDMNAQQIAFNLMKLVDKMDQQFVDAKSAPDTAALFIESDVMFGSLPIVLSPGFIEDRIGQEAQTELDNRKT